MEENKTGFFALLSRMRYIGRWGLMRSSIPENVQEHTCETAVYAHALGIIRRDVLGRECDAERLAVLALYHDASEILTGDLPTPIKYHDKKIRNAYKAVEAAAVIPLERLMIETDAPYMAPVPHRGKRNQSDYTLFIAQKIAEIKGLSEEEVIAATTENGKRFFNIP